MTKDLLLFPAGRAGAALALLRVAAAILLVGSALQAASAAGWVGIAACALALSMLLGLFTRVAAGLFAVAAAVICLRFEGLARLSVVAHCLTGAALCMLGPGAYSLDARLFGRRVIDFHS